MSTPITQPSTTETPARERVPAPEKSAEVTTLPPYTPPGSSDPGDPPGALAKSVARWVHQHPQAHKHGFGNLTYQFLRSLAAAAPYGVSMAGVLAAFTGMERLGGKLASTGSSNLVKGFGRNLEGFAKFQPARWSALIGASFTFYRGTSKLGKWLTEYVFNPKDSEALTAEKLHDLPQELVRKVKEIAPAEVSSTPIAAVVLGFIVTTFTKPYNYTKELLVGGRWEKQQHILADLSKQGTDAARNLDWTAANFRATPGLMNKLKLMGSVIAHPNAKFVQQAAINTFGYALFFEMGDRLFKDTQIRRGVWPGEHHSIKALKAAPDEYAQGIQDGNAASRPKFEDSAAEAKQEKHHYGFFTNEPSFGRFLFRRVLPTAVGITAYTGAKMRWASMLGNDFSYKAGESLIRKIPKLALGEGLATSLFFLIPIVSEPWEKAYDKFWAKKETVAQLKDQMRDHPELYAQKPTAHQTEKYEELLARVNAKAQAANESVFAQRA